MQPNEVRSLPLRRLRAPLTAALFVMALAAAPVVTATPAVAARPSPRVTAHTGVLIDARTGAVLWQRGLHEPVRIASTTKILTALVAEHVYPANKVFKVSKAAENVDGTRFGYQAGMRVRRHDLLTTMLMVSANDAAETLAGAYPQGGRAGFLAAMQAEAASLGCTDSTWRDPPGARRDRDGPFDPVPLARPARPGHLQPQPFRGLWARPRCDRHQDRLHRSGALDDCRGPAPGRA